MKEFAVGSIFIAAVGGVIAALFFALQTLESQGVAGNTQLGVVIVILMMFAPAKYVGEGFIASRKRK